VGFGASLRAGFRFAPVVGAELGVEYARVGAHGHGHPSFADTPGVEYPLSYTFQSVRVGAHVRLMTTGERVRFVQTIGGGVMADAMSWDAGSSSATRQNAKGADAFGMSETGFEVDLKSVLLGLTAQNVIASSGALDHPQHTQFSGNTYGGAQFSIGLGLRAGYRLW
jgi:hypothetical protein